MQIQLISYQVYIDKSPTKVYDREMVRGFYTAGLFKIPDSKSFSEVLLMLTGTPYPPFLLLNDQDLVLFDSSDSVDNLFKTIFVFSQKLIQLF